MAGRVAADSSCVLHFMASTLTGAAPPTPASAHLPRPHLCACAAPASQAQARVRSLPLSSAERPFSAFPPSAATVVRGGGREGAGKKGGRWVSARAARPPWFPGCARRWRRRCSCCSSGEDGGRAGARPDLRVGAARDPGHSGSAGREQRNHEGAQATQR